jgi:hypothetical protein
MQFFNPLGNNASRPKTFLATPTMIRPFSGQNLKWTPLKFTLTFKSLLTQPTFNDREIQFYLYSAEYLYFLIYLLCTDHGTLLWTNCSMMQRSWKLEYTEVFFIKRCSNTLHMLYC